MSYDPTIDFLALTRQTSAGVATERMPGLDYVVAALSRMGFITLSVGQEPPMANQTTTVWLRTSLPSWVAEGTVYLWSAVSQDYEPATPALWNALLAPNGYTFQSVGSLTAAVSIGTSLLAIERVAPSATALTLPNMLAQFTTGRALSIVDWSSAVTDHTITLTTPDGSTIMRQASFVLRSSDVQLAGATLRPAPELNGWVIAP